MTQADKYKEIEDSFRASVASDWVCSRFDGKNFSKLTKDFDRPFDIQVADAMDAAVRTMFHIMVPSLAYTVSDEISLIWKVDRANGQQLPWGGDIQKIASIGAAAATLGASGVLPAPRYTAVFDGRVFAVNSKEEAVEYLRTRFVSGKKNSIASLAQTMFSQKKLHGVPTKEMLKMITDERPDKDWSTYPDEYRFGMCYFKEAFQIDGPDGPVTRHRLTKLSADKWSGEGLQ